MLLSALYQSTGRFAEAHRLCQQLARIQPDQPMHYLNLGSLDLRLQHPDEADIAFRKATVLAEANVRRNPTAPNYYLLSVAYDRTGNVRGALTAAARALELDPDNARYKQLLALLRNRARMKDDG
jgi:tetratricopeptide (TPR) repeat protein